MQDKDYAVKLRKAWVANPELINQILERVNEKASYFLMFPGLAELKIEMDTYKDQSELKLKFG